ncbi:MAG: hypothetical protein Q8L09_00455 [Candidatus Moranbacteria bacterium]|nr:hypothetical protein [Candidatus Moranbacteria bacterium]
MIKKIIFLLVILVVLLAWLGGIFSVSFSPFSLTINKPEKDFLKKVVRKVEGFVYHEATIHNPAGDMLPDQIDDQVKGEIKKIVN